MFCEENHLGHHCCEKLDRLRGKPQECTPEQIREHHGEAKEHPYNAKGEPA
jgi:hypothetical protein